MIVQQRVFDVDDLWRLVCDSDDDRRYELINGELFEMAPTGELHGLLAGDIYHFIRLFDPERKLGIAAVDAGYYSPDNRSTLLSPDVAFRRADRATPPLTKAFVPVMPDLAVEIISPSNTMPQIRRKAAIYLQHGTQLVWIVIPNTKTAEVCRLDASGEIQTEFISADGSLSGEDVLPGFSLELSALFF